MKNLKEIIRGFGSELERRIYKEFLAFGLKPEIQYQIGYYFVDFAFPEKKLAIEIDGKSYHGTLQQRKRDNFRDGHIKNKGWKIERFPSWLVWTYKDIVPAKIGLRYFKNKLSKKMINHGRGVLATFLVKEEIDGKELACNI